MEYVLLILATVATSAKAIFCKIAGGVRGARTFLINAQALAVSALLIALLRPSAVAGVFYAAPLTLFLAVGCAVSMSVTQICQMRALNTGSPSATTLIYSTAFLLPILYSLFRFGERVSVGRWIGVGLLLAALVLIVGERRQGRFSFLWLLFVCLATLGSGTSAILQKEHQLSDAGAELFPFLLVSFLTAAVLSLILYLIMKNRMGEGNHISPRLLTRLSPLVLGAINGVMSILNMKLTGLLPAVIQFPISNIGSLLLTTLVCILAFHDTFTKRKAAGFAFGIAAVLLIGLC